MGDRTSSQAASSNSPVQHDGCPSSSLAPDDMLDSAPEEQEHCSSLEQTYLMAPVLAEETDLGTVSSAASSSNCPVQQNGRPRPVSAGYPDIIVASAEKPILDDATKRDDIVQQVHYPEPSTAELDLAEFQALAAKLE